MSMNFYLAKDRFYMTFVYHYSTVTIILVYFISGISANDVLFHDENNLTFYCIDFFLIFTILKKKSHNFLHHIHSAISLKFRFEKQVLTIYHAYMYIYLQYLQSLESISDIIPLLL